MIAATYTQNGEFAVRDIPPPEISTDELLLRVRAASICGTDMKIIRNGHRKLADDQRIVLGHEFVGTIEQAGSDVSQFSMGKRVGVAPNAGCGCCDGCIRGQSNYCDQYTALGIDRDGAHAPLVKIPAQFIAQGNVIELPDSVSDQAAALLEPFSCVVNGAQNIGLGFGDSVLVFGAGPMGLLHVMLARSTGAAFLIAVDPEQDRLERAAELGCDLTINPDHEDVLERVNDQTGGRGVDVVITACSVPSVQTEAVSLLAPFGRLCLFGGLPIGSHVVPMDTNTIHYKNLWVTGSTGGSVRDYRTALELVARQKVDVTKVISDVFTLGELDKGYETALAGAAGKVAFVSEA